MVRGIILTRPGFEERAKSTANLQELIKWLPSDLFRTALAPGGSLNTNWLLLHVMQVLATDRDATLVTHLPVLLFIG